MPQRSLVERLRERKLAQWTIAYLAGASVVFQGVEVLAEPWGIPPAWQRSVHVLLLLGLVLTLVLAWYHGEKGQQRLSGPELLIVAGVLAVAGAGLWMVQWNVPPQPTPPQPARSDLPASLGRRSLAVLPFANLSRESEDVYLADGLHEEVLDQLSKVSALRVVSRTSVMAYRASGRPVGEIAAELGVEAVVEGSVQRVLDRIRVTTQLIDASTDERVWAETFDREFSLDGVLDLQTEIAQKIAFGLRAEMTPEERTRMQRRDTQNWEAYRAFLRGRYYMRLPHYTVASQDRALAHFRRAVTLDSTFALAWAELAEAQAQQVFYWTDASEERRESARFAARQAMQVDSPSPEVRLVMALYHLWLDRDAEHALAEIAVAEREMPDIPSVRQARAYAYEVSGRFEDAILEYESILVLSPRDPAVYTSLALDHWLIRDYDAGAAYADQALDLAPDQMWPNLAKVFILWSRSGASLETAEILRDLSGASGWVTWARYWQLMLDDRFSEAIQFLDETDFEWIRLKMWARPKPLLQAMSWMAMDRPDTATALFEEAGRILEGEVALHPDDPRYRSSLGLAYAGLGRGGSAVREGERAVSLLPLSLDAFYGLPYVWDLAAIHSMLGDGAAAVGQIEGSLSGPSWVSPAWIRGDFRLDRIRDDARFRALLEAFEAGSGPGPEGTASDGRWPTR
jgi:TolB-like protein/Flp pilus assembly protein TadD